MNSHKLPDGWTVDNLEDQGSIYGDLPEFNDPSRVFFFGLLDEDQEYKIYSVPSDTAIERIVQAFKVGSHGAMSYGFDADSVISLVTENVKKIQKIIPCYVIFVDAAGLKLKFESQITEKEILQIEAIFLKQNCMKAGLERYAIEYEEGKMLLAPLREENLIHLWWD